MSINHVLKAVILAGVVLSVASPAAIASPTTFDITLNTSSLVGLGKFSLAFQLASGAATGNGDNTVTLFNFNFNGGNTTGSLVDLNGGATGSFSSGVSITDNNTFFFNEMDENFTPGSSVSFGVTLSNNAETGALSTPDLFTMSLLNGTGFGVPTLDPSGNNTMFTITLNGALAPPVGAWRTNTAQTTYNVPAPIIAPAPEPGSLMLLGSGLAGWALLRIRRRCRG